MTTIFVQDKYAEILATFGDLEESVNLALQRYMIEQISNRIAELRRRTAEYETRYGLEYPAFAQRIAEDEAFVHYVESNINKTWEADLADWEFCHKGIEDWKKKLENILLA